MLALSILFVLYCAVIGYPSMASSELALAYERMRSLSPNWGLIAVLVVWWLVTLQYLAVRRDAPFRRAARFSDSDEGSTSTFVGLLLFGAGSVLAVAIPFVWGIGIVAENAFEAATGSYVDADWSWGLSALLFGCSPIVALVGRRLSRGGVRSSEVNLERSHGLDR